MYFKRFFIKNSKTHIWSFPRTPVETYKLKICLVKAVIKSFNLWKTEMKTSLCSCNTHMLTLQTCIFFLKGLCALFLPGMAWTKSPHSTMNLGLGRSWFTASTACLVSSTSSAHSSPPLSQSPSLQAFMSPSWGSAAWMKQNGPVHLCSASGKRRDKNGLSSCVDTDRSWFFNFL